MSQRIDIEHRPGAMPAQWRRMSVAAGHSVEEIVMHCYGSADGIECWALAPDGRWEIIPRHLRAHVRPRRSGVLRFTYRMNGGKIGNIFATIAAIALAVFAPGIGTFLAGTLGLGALGPTGFAIASGILGSTVAIGGSILLAKLFPPETGAAGGVLGQSSTAKESTAYQDVSSDANVLAKDAFLPIVVGSRRISPPDLMQPRGYIEDGIQTIDRCLGLWGRHALSNIQVDGTPVESIPAITVETKDGAETTGVYTFIDEISVTTPLGEELSTFAVDGTDLEDQATPSNAEPRWLSFSTPDHEALEEIAIRLRIDGFVTSDSATQKSSIPIRIRFRVKGAEDWINLPEMHLRGRATQTLVRDIRLRWDENFGAPDIDGDLQWVFWREVPAPTVDLSTHSSDVQWDAADWFSGGSGLTAVNHITSQRFGVRAFLDPATFAKGAFEFQIMRGAAVNSGDLDSNYKIGGTVYSLFLSYDDDNVWSVPVAQGGFLGRITPVQATTIASRYPTEWPETALIALKSKGNSVSNITTQAARYVMDWDGSAWATETATSKNPATHYRQILFDFLTFYGFDTSLIDNDAFVAWRQECIDRGYEVSAVFAGDTVGDSLDAIATAGYATKRFSDGFSIDYFRDRSSDVPVQTFSPRNGKVQFSITTPQRPFGYRVSYQNEDNDWLADELDVTLDNAADVNNWEAVSYKAISNETLVRRRAYFDLLQADLRRRQWTVDTSIEGVFCEKGDLVSVVSDLFDDKSQGTRIRDVIDATHIAIDQVIPGSDPGPDITDGASVENVFTTAGDRSIVFIHTPDDGVIMRTIVNVADDVIELDEALPTLDVIGAHVNVTTLSNTSHRCFVLSIDRPDEGTATLTLVDEAPEIWTKMQRKFG